MDYKVFGALICCSGVGIVRPERVKRLIDQLSKMGYNYLELCTDDTYKIEDEPYFGYLLGGYTKEEIKDMDAYARSKGVELVPAIQTLGHQSNLVKLPHYADIVDIDSILLVDEPKTYELIEKMFKTLRECYTTKHVNIGFDEAHNVGRGRYLDKHGFVNHFDLLLRHLNRVIEIAKKYDFKVHMWSDMFYRLYNKQYNAKLWGGYYSKEVLHLPKDVLDKVPEDVGMTLWMYENADPYYEPMIISHKEDFKGDFWYAGVSGFTANGFAPFNKCVIRSMKLAMEQVRKHNVENVIMTIWNDDGHDCPFENALPSLYATRQFADGNFDMDKIKKGFKEMFGVEFDDFMKHDLINKSKKNPDLLKCVNACKSLLFNDCFVGWKDGMLKEEYPIPYGEYAKELEEILPRMGDFKYITEMLIALARTLEVKYDLGLRTRKAYQEGDKKELKKLVDDYLEAANRLKVFREKFRYAYMLECKPYNWEIHEIRLSGLYGRIMDCRDRLIEYLDGKVKDIPELTETILPYADWGLQWNMYKGSVSVSSL